MHYLLIVDNTYIVDEDEILWDMADFYKMLFSTIGENEEI